jgi:molybdopterin-guanine dinucleotide biosynthesis protein A
MGADKAMLLYRGTPLAAYVARQVAAVTGRVWLIGPAERYGLLGYPVMEDREPGCGPLGGIVTALAQTDSAWNMIAACDMPGITSDFVENLFALAEGGDVDVVMPQGPSGVPDPLCAVYHRRCFTAVDTAFRNGTRKVTAALDGLRVFLTQVDSADALHNVNTPNDWAALR